MNPIHILATFFGWCAVINIGIMLIFVLIMSVLNKDGFIIELSMKIFGNTKEDTLATMFRVFHQFRLLIVVLNVVPYIALRIMA
jgi:Family of unknown function (DUF6868)